MVQRTRRANAGNRLQSLIAEQAPLDDAEAAFFAERDDDEDFDLEAEEERIRQERLAAEHASQSGDEEGSGNEDEDENEEGDDDDDDDESDGEHDDENFSDSEGDSDSDRDEDPVDAGEKELQKEQRQHVKEKRVAERNKLFKIKKRPPPRDENEPPKEPKKKRVFMSADILLEKGRHSERKSALRNKHHLIEQMREAEKRRAQYVPPKRTKAPKLTQEQRLEEAKKTEARNLSSLNKFVELEEERKIQQRLSMISRRPRLTHFVRLHSTQYMEPPKLIEVIEKSNDDDVKDELDIKEELDADGKQEDSKPEDIKKEEDDAKKEANKESEANDQNKDENKEKDPEQPPVSESGASDAANADQVAKPESGDSDVEPVKVEEVEKDPLYGPSRLKTYDFLTLHEFQDVHINKYSIRSIVLGPVASALPQQPLKRMCPFTGQEARYLDPKTKVAYTDLQTNKLIKMARDNKLGWSKELGGVFTSNGKDQRHAKGVPEGFA